MIVATHGIVASGQSLPITSNLYAHLDAGNVSSYPGTGTVWADLTSTGANANLIAAPDYLTTNGGIFQFDGVSDYAKLTNTANCFGQKTQFTAEIWCKLPNTTRFNTILSYGDNNAYSNDILFYVYQGKLSLQVNNGADGSADVTFTDTGWNQITIVFDGTQIGNANRLKAYVNTVAQTLSFGSYTVPTNNGQLSTQCGIAAYSTGNYNNLLLGNIAIIRLYTIPLTQSQISQNFNSNRSRYGI